ncbi:MAG TPA: hypothetical protein VLA43_11020 [Longimicrobiales bacterium]|nr:hypothetical protein [Longimicrobiales bacterium]
MSPLRPSSTVVRPARLLWILTGAVLAVPGQAQGQARLRSDVISSDRPGLGDGAHVLAPGVWQGEFGGTIQAQYDDDFLVGSSLLRIGFSALELRVYLPDAVSLHEGDFLRFGDLGVGAKFPLDLGGGWRWAGTGLVTLPTGASALTADDPGGGGALIAGRSLSSSLSLTFNAGYGFLFNDLGGGTLSFVATPTLAVPGYEGLSVYAGYATYIREGDDAHYVEGGFARLSGPDRQWDVNAGYDPGAHVWFLGVGLAVRSR